MVGLELDKQALNGHEGTVRGKEYFVSPKGRGLFVEKSFIVSFVVNDKSDHFRILPDPGDRVLLRSGETGEVFWIGVESISDLE